MNIPDKVLALIQREQAIQDGVFIPNQEDYLIKLANKAELITHEEFGECLGFIFFYCNDLSKCSSYITLILVAQSSRKLGIGAALIKHVLTLTALRGFEVCRLEVRKENAAAIKLYKSLGFIEIEDRSDKYLLEAQAI